MSLSTIGEILARNTPGYDPARLTVPAPDPGPARLTAEEEAEMYRAYAARWHDAHVPAEFAAARLGAEVPPPVAQWVRAYIDGTAGTRHSLLLNGRVGRGKTWLAYAALRAIADAGCPRFAWRGGTVTEVFARLRPNSGEPRTHVLRELSTAPLLLLDDLGASKDSEWTEETILELVDTRSRHRLPLIITTNATPNDLRAKIGDRALSRLIGMSVEHELAGPDRRRAA